MAASYAGLTIEFEGKDKSLSTVLNSIKKNARGVTTELRNIKRGLKLDPGNVRLVAAQQEALNKLIANTTERLDALKRTEREIGRKGMSTDQWVKLQSDIAEAESRLASYKRELTELLVQQSLADSKLARFGDGMIAAGARLDRVSGKMAAIGSTLSRTVTVGVAAASAATIAAAVEIDTSLTNVRKTVDGTEEQYAALKASAIEFSKTNAVSASQILDIQALGAQLGFNIEELDMFGRVVSGLDIATNMDAETAATELAQFANITKMAHDEAGNYASTIVDLGNSFATTEADISHMAMRIAGAGSNIGMSQADILGVATALSSMGIEAEAGGTAISTIMSQIDKAVALQSESLATWAETAGMSSEQFSAAWKANAVGTLSDVLVAMDAATQSGGNMSVMLDELGIQSIRQTDTLKRLANNSEFLGQAVDTANTAWRENTALQAEVDNRNNSLSAKFEMVKNRVVAVAEQVGGPLADALLDAVDAAEPLFAAIESGAKAFSGMSREEQQLIVGLLAISAAAGPVMSVGGKLVGVAGKGAAGLGKLAKLMATASATASATGVSFGTAVAGVEGFGKAMSALRFVGAAAALAIIVTVVSELARCYEEANRRAEEARERQERLTQASAGLEQAASGATAALKEEAEATEEVASAASAVDLDALTQAHIELAQSMTDANSDAYQNIEMLSKYGDSIQRLAGRSNLTAEEIAELKAAVDAASSATGQSWSVAQDASGAYQVMGDGAVIAAESIYQLVEAQKAQIRFEASRGNYEAAYKQLASDSQAYAQQLAAVTAKQQEYDAAVAKRSASATQEDWAASSVEVNRLATELDAAKQSLAGVEQQMGAAQSAANKAEEQWKLASMAQEQGASGLMQWAASSVQFQAAVQGMNVDLIGFTQALEQMGLSQQQIASMEPAIVQQLASSWAMGTGQMLLKCQELGVAIPQELQAAFASAQAAVDAAGINLLSAQMRVKDGMLQAWSSGRGEFVAVTAEMMSAITGKVGEGAPSVQDAVSGMADGACVVWDAATGRFVQAASGAVSQTAGVMQAGAASVTSAMAGLVEGVDYAAETVRTTLPESGEEGGAGFAEGIANAQGDAESASGSLAEASKETGKYKGDSFLWGAHLGGNFARGISSQAGAVQSAAAALAAAANGPIHFTHPDWGPLRHGTEVYGEHLAQNFAGGIKGATHVVARRAEGLAQAVADYIGHTSPKAGPLRGGEWVYGYHAAVNFAAGLKSGKKAVAAETEEIAAKLKGDLKKLSVASKELALEATDAAWETAKSIASAYEYAKPSTDEVYASMKALDDAGYTVDSYIAKWEELAGKSIDWKGKLPESEHKRFVEEVAEFQELQKAVGMSAEELEHYRDGMQKVVIETTEGTESATRLTGAIGNLSSRGIAFSKEFVEAFAGGSEEYQGALVRMATWTDAEVQGMVDAWEDMRLAEREQEIAARRLHVESLEAFDMKKPKEWMLDFEETVLDVKEAVHSKKGLSGAFDASATSVDGFALDLQALEMTMGDFLSFQESFTSKVSDGFSAMTRGNMTSLDEWKENISNNIAESQAYAKSVEAVFAKIGPGDAADEFRRAVMDEGYEKWGQVMSDLAGASSREIAEVVELYSKAMAEGQQSAIAQMQAISPGEELVRESIAAIVDAQMEVERVAGETAEAGADAALAAKPAWYVAGTELMEGVRGGIMARASSIAAAAADAVRMAIEAAQAAAGIASPSKVMKREVGEMLIAGGIAGIEKRAPDMERAMGATLASVARVPQGDLRETQSVSQVSYSVQAPVTIHATVRSDLDIKKLAREVSSVQDRSMRGRGLMRA